MNSINVRQPSHDPAGNYRELDELETRVRSHLGARVQGLRLWLHHDGIVLSGTAPNYYSKQLAQHAVMRLSRRPIAANEIEVC